MHFVSTRTRTMTPDTFEIIVDIYIIIGVMTIASSILRKWQFVSNSFFNLHTVESNNGKKDYL